MTFTAIVVKGNHTLILNRIKEMFLEKSEGISNESLHIPLDSATQLSHPRTMA